MKETSCMRWSRSVHGSRPSTFKSPSYEVRPRIALSAVVLPAPLGPISPRMWPSSTRRSMPASATVAPKTLRMPRASIHAMALGLLLSFFGIRWSVRRLSEQFFRLQPEPLNSCVDPGPLFGKKLLAFALQQQIARAGIDEHATASPGLHKSFVYQLLITLQDRERIDPIFGCHIAHRGQRIAFLENSVEYHRHHAIAKLAINRLTVVPLTVHPVFQRGLTEKILPSVCTLQIKATMDELVPHHERPILGVMIGVNHGEYCMVHVSVFGIAGNIEELEFHCLPVGRHLAGHPRAISCVAIMSQQQTVPV